MSQPEQKKKPKSSVSDTMMMFLGNFPLTFSKVTKINTPNFMFTIDTFGKDTIEYRVIYSSSFEEFIENNTEYFKGLYNQ